jgi:hypothetical protein
MSRTIRGEGLAGGAGVSSKTSGMTSKQIKNIAEKTIKSSAATIKQASKKQSSKLTAKEREYQKDKISRKEMKQMDTFYNRANKEELKKGKPGLSALSSKSQSKALKPKVPVKRIGKK